MSMGAYQPHLKILDKLPACRYCNSFVEEARDCAGFYNYRCSDYGCDNALYNDYEHYATGRAAWKRKNTKEKD